MIEECGPFVLSGLHYLYDQQRQFNRAPPPHVRPVWDEYCRLVEQTPARGRHLRVHAGHCTYSLPEEEQFVTPDLIRASCLAGTAEEVRAQVRTLAEAGLDQLMLLPSLATQERVIEQFHDQVMAKL